MVRLFGARSALPRRPVSFGPCSRARRRQALVRWSPLHRFEARRFWGSQLPLPRGHISASSANLSRRSRPRRAVVTATACAGFRRHGGVFTKVRYASFCTQSVCTRRSLSPLLSLALGAAGPRSALYDSDQKRAARSRDALVTGADNTGRSHRVDSGGATQGRSTAASVFTGLRRARKRQRITTRRARDFHRVA